MKSDPIGSRPSHTEIVVVLAILVLALSLKVPLLGRGFQGDEIWTVVDFVEAPSTWQAVSRIVEFNNHHLYTLLARGAEAALGRAEWVVRLPALLFGLLTIPAVWLGLRRGFGPRTALLSALLVATNPVLTGFSTTARGYSGMVFFSWCATVVFLRLVQEGRGVGRAVLYALIAILGIGTHFFTVAVLAVHGVFLVLIAARELRRGGVSSAWSRLQAPALALGSVVLLGAVFSLTVVPKLLPLILSSGGGDFLPTLPLLVLAYVTGRPPNAVGVFVAATALAGLVVGLRGRRLEALLLPLLIALPLGAIWLAQPDGFRARFFVFLVPVFSLGLALAIEAVVRAGARTPGTAVLRAGTATLVLLAVGLWMWPPWGNVPRGSFREAVAALEAPPSRPGARVGLCAIGWRPHLYAWYAKRPILLPGSVEEFEAFVASHDGVRCVQIAGVGNPPAHQAIERLLESRCGPPENFRQVRVYRCER